MADTRRDPEHPGIEGEVEPTAAGRTARWAGRADAVRTRVEAARASHASVDVGFIVIERDSAIGGGLLAGALAYRLFVVLLPSALLFVSGIGVYASTAHKSPSTVAKEAGLHGLIASEVASSASSRSRWIVFLVMLPALLYALAKLYRALAIVHAIAWTGSGRGVRTTAKGVVVVGGAILGSVATAAAVGWIRRHEQLGSLPALAFYLVVAGSAWLAVSVYLPHLDARWTALIPGAVVVAIGLSFVNVFNVYVTTRLVENQANTYGALGIAAALLLSLVLVGRLIVVAAELNASLYDRRAPSGS